MKKIIIPLILLVVSIIILLSSCKKNNIEQPAKPVALLADGPMSPELGKRINLDSYGLIKYYGNIWGRNSDELFLSTETKLLRLDLSTPKIDDLENSGGLFTRKTNENNAVLFLGPVNAEYGYYAYHFNGDTTEKIVDLATNQSSDLAIAGNSMFVYIATQGPPSHPCTGDGDFICSDNPETVSSSFYFQDRITKTKISLPGKSFVRFSKDGTKTILRSDGYSFLSYIFNNITKTMEDSFAIGMAGPSIYYDDVIKYASFPSSNNEGLIENALTHEPLYRFTSSAKYDGTPQWSEDGTKIYYWAFPEDRSPTIFINIFDLITRKEKTICKFTWPPNSVSTTDLQLVLSSDNKRFLIKYMDDYYVKDVE